MPKGLLPDFPFPADLETIPRLKPLCDNPVFTSRSCPT